MKIVGIFLSVVITLGACFASVTYYQTASNSEQFLNQERYQRMVLEEDLQKSQAEITSLESSVARLQNKVNSLDKIVDQSKAVNQNLKVRLSTAESARLELEKSIENLQRLAAEKTLESEYVVEN